MDRFLSYCLLCTFFLQMYAFLLSLVSFFVCIFAFWFHFHLFILHLYFSPQINKIQKGRNGFIIDRVFGFFFKTYQDRMPVGDLLPEITRDYRYYTKRRNCCRYYAEIKLENVKGWCAMLKETAPNVSLTKSTNEFNSWVLASSIDCQIAQFFLCFPEVGWELWLRSCKYFDAYVCIWCIFILVGSFYIINSLKYCK